MSTDLIQYERWGVPERVKYSNTLADAADLIPRGLFDRSTGRPSPAKIFLVMETGAMLGLHPMAAIQGIDVIEGRASVSPRVMLGLLRAAGHKVRIEETGSVETGDAKATVTLWRKDDPDEPISASFTVDMALRAGLIDSYNLDPTTKKWIIQARSDKGKVLPWEAYTEDLLIWRAVARLGRRGGQDVLMGVGYIPEELEATVDEEGVPVPYDTAAADVLRAEFKTFDDKADMAAFWKAHHEDDVWDEAFQAEFAAHLSTLTKDSRPPKDGAPGHTGHSTIDGGTTTPAGQETPADGQQQPDEAEPTAPGLQPLEGADEEPVWGHRPEDVVDAEEIDPDEWERQEIARHEAELRKAGQ